MWGRRRKVDPLSGDEIRRDSFTELAQSHRQTVGNIKERNRKRRLRYLLYANLVVFALLLRRAIEERPIEIGLPDLGPNGAFYLLGFGFFLILILAVLGPMLINGRSPAMRFGPEEIGVRFDDVRGLDGVLEEVTRTLQIFLAYKAFREELGGNPRRGILFEGPPGTGKTHLAKAMAAEAGVPFFFVSAPAFQSMWFGMTAFKIRAFFRSLKKAARREGGAIGFLEEIDAIGGARAGMSQFAAFNGGGTTTERMVDSGGGGMVNELLIQMQSFEAPPFWGRVLNKMKSLVNSFLPAGHQLKKSPPVYNNVLIIAATNRADTLDPALTRPGRFDRILHFDVPSRAARRDLVDYFLGKRAHSEEMDSPELREELAAMTLGYTPAMIEHVLDESLVWALRDGRRQLSWQDVSRARLSEEIGLGQPVAYTSREKEIISTHEAGHAVVAYLCAPDRKLDVLSIIKRRQALGLLAHSDVEERFTQTRSELEGRMKIMLGGMAAEHIFFGETGTGPSSDLAAATTLVAEMIGTYGMGKNLASYEAVRNGMHSNPNIVAKILSSDETRDELNSILQLNRDFVTGLLTENRDLVEALRDALLEREELLGDEITGELEKAVARRSA